MIAGGAVGTSATVIGAGVTGASVAAALAGGGVPVVVVARGSADGETSRSAGVVRLMGDTPELVEASLPWFRARPPGRGGLAAGGVVTLSRAVDTADVAATVARVDAERVTLVPPDAPGGELAVVEPGSGWVEPDLVAGELLREAVAHGCRAVRAEAHAVTPSGDGWVVETSGGRIRSGTVVVAAGLASAGLLAGAGVDLPVSRTPVAAALLDRGTPELPAGGVGAVGPVGPVGSAGPDPSAAVVADMVQGVLVRPHACGTLVALAPSWPTDDLAALPFAELADAARAEVPAGRLVRAWEGAYDTTPDGRPYLGEVRPGLVAAFGLNGGGVKVAPAVGRAVADVACGRDAPLLAPYRPDRPDRLPERT